VAVSIGTETKASGDSPQKRWAVPSPEEIASLRSQPRFFEASCFMAASLAEMFQKSHALSVLLSDRARQLIGYVALHLHWSGVPGTDHPGLTIGKLKAICVEQKFCSASRVEVMVAAMRLFGFARVERDPYDHRVKLLVLTEKPILAQLRRWRRQFTAMTMIMPEGQLGLDGLEHPEFPPALAGKLYECYASGVRLITAVPGLDKFMDRNSGMAILLHLTATSVPVPDIPGARAAMATVSGLSKRFHVSRAHVRKLLDEGEKAGYFRRTDSDSSRILVLQPWIDTFETIYAATFIQLGDCAREAWREIARGDARARYGIERSGSLLPRETPEPAWTPP
jgi:DNA-binding MarR family transcriptional regulator